MAKHAELVQLRGKLANHTTQQGGQNGATDDQLLQRRDQITQLTATISMKETELLDATSLSTEKDAEIRRLTEACEIDLENQLVTDAELGQLREQIDQLNLVILDMDAELNRAREGEQEKCDQILELEEKLASAPKQTSPAGIQRIQLAWGQGGGAKESELTALRMDLDGVKAAALRATEEHDINMAQLSAQLAAAQRDATKAQMLHEDAASHVEAQHADLAALKKLVAVKDAEAERTESIQEERLAECRRQLQLLQFETNGIEAEHVEKNAQLEEARAHLAAVEASNQLKEEDANTLTERLTAKTVEVSQLSAQLDAVSAVNESSKCDLQEKCDEKSALLQELQIQLREHLSEAGVQEAANQAQLNCVHAQQLCHVADKEAEMAALELELAGLRAELAEAQGDLVSCHLSAADQTKDQENLQQQLSASYSNAAFLEAELKETRTQLLSTGSELAMSRGNVAQMEAVCADAAGRLADQDKLATSQSDAAYFESELLQTREQLETATNQATQMEKQLVYMRGEADEQAAKHERLSKSQSDAAFFETELIETRDQLKSTESALHTKAAEFVELQVEFAQLEASSVIQAAEQHIESLDDADSVCCAAAPLAESGSSCASSTCSSIDEQYIQLAAANTRTEQLQAALEDSQQQLEVANQNFEMLKTQTESKVNQVLTDAAQTLHEELAGVVAHEALQAEEVSQAREAVAAKDVEMKALQLHLDKNEKIQRKAIAELQATLESRELELVQMRAKLEAATAGMQQQEAEHAQASSKQSEQSDGLGVTEPQTVCLRPLDAVFHSSA